MDNSKKERIGIFGGSFDPFTEAHMAIVEAVLREDLVDLVVLVPTIVDYHRVGKEKWLTDIEKYRVINFFVCESQYHHRICMDFTELDERASGTISEERARNWRFIDTLTRIKGKLESGGVNAELYTIIGTDSLQNFKTWSRWEDILLNSRLICVEGRNGTNPSTDIDYIPVQIPEKYMDVSSTRVRDEFNDVDEYIHHIATERQRQGNAS